MTWNFDRSRTEWTNGVERIVLDAHGAFWRMRGDEALGSHLTFADARDGADQRSGVVDALQRAAAAMRDAEHRFRGAIAQIETVLDAHGVCSYAESVAFEMDGHRWNFGFVREDDGGITWTCLCRDGVDVDPSDVPMELRIHAAQLV